MLRKLARIAVVLAGLWFAWLAFMGGAMSQRAGGGAIVAGVVLLLTWLVAWVLRPRRRTSP